MSFYKLLMISLSLIETMIIVVVVVLLKNMHYWKKLKPFKSVVVYVGICFSLFVITFPNDIVTILKGKSFYNTLFFYNWQNVINTFVLICIYKSLLESKHIKKILGLLAFGFLISVVLDLQDDSLTYYNSIKYNTYTFTVSNLIAIYLSLTFAYEMIQDLSIDNIIKYPYFWLNFGVLFYYAGSMFVDFSMTFLSKDDLIFIWVIKAFLQLVFYLCLALSIHFTKYFSTKPK